MVVVPHLHAALSSAVPSVLAQALPGAASKTLPFPLVPSTQYLVSAAVMDPVFPAR